LHRRLAPQTNHVRAFMIVRAGDHHVRRDRATW
jgi:hypothetical protein